MTKGNAKFANMWLEYYNLERSVELFPGQYTGSLHERSRDNIVSMNNLTVPTVIIIVVSFSYVKCTLL